MEYDDRSGVSQFASGLLLGVVIGAGIALLSAPESGRRTRRRIRRAATDARDQAGDRWDEVSGDMKDAVDRAIGSARNKIAR